MNKYMYIKLYKYIAAPMMQVLPIRRKINSTALERTPATLSRIST